MTKAREPAKTVACVDDYCAHDRSVFTTVRHVEQVTHLELGLLAPDERKSLPRVATRVNADHPAAAPLPRPGGMVGGGDTSDAAAPLRE